MLLALIAFLTAFASPLLADDLIENFGVVTPDVLYRGSKPSLEGMRVLAENYRVKTILNLEKGYFGREDEIEEEERAADFLGIQFINEPLSVIRPPSEEQISRILSVLSNPKNHPVYVHCLKGRDRTGIIVALYSVLIAKLTPQQACADLFRFRFKRVRFAHFLDYLEEQIGAKCESE